MRPLFIRRLIVSGLAFSSLLGLGCSPASGPTPAATAVKAAAKPQVIVLELEGKAKRVNRNQIVVTLRDTGGAGSQVREVSTMELDKLTTSDGKAVPARLSDYRWQGPARESKNESKNAEGPAKEFELQLLIDTPFAEPTGVLEGAFRTYGGTPVTIDIPIKDHSDGEVDDPRLKAASIIVKLTKTDAEASASISGPQPKLLAATFVGGSRVFRPERTSRARLEDRAIEVSVESPTPETVLQLRIAEDGFENMQVYKIDPLTFEP